MRNKPYDFVSGGKPENTVAAAEEETAAENVSKDDIDSITAYLRKSIEKIETQNKELKEKLANSSGAKPNVFLIAIAIIITAVAVYFIMKNKIPAPVA